MIYNIYSKRYCLFTFYYFFRFLTFTLTLFRIGWRQKGPPTSLFPATSTSVGINQKNFFTISFNSFVTLVKSFKTKSSSNPKLLNLKPAHPSKKNFFLVKSLWNCCYDNFSHRNARVTKLWSHDYIYS